MIIILQLWLLVGLTASLSIMLFRRVVFGEDFWTANGVRSIVTGAIFTVFITAAWPLLLIYIGTQETGALKE